MKHGSSAEPPHTKDSQGNTTCAAGASAEEFLLTRYIHRVYTNFMRTTKVFKSGNSQAVRLPKEFQFDSSEVEIFRRGDEIVLRKKAATLTRAYELLTKLPDDFMQEGRAEDLPQEREDL
jgi:antitoxin VapB